jgi:1,4-alpha-glucan branching enzyme
MPFGAEFQSGGSVRFSLWAPNHERIAVELDAAAPAWPMRRWRPD